MTKRRRTAAEIAESILELDRRSDEAAARRDRAKEVNRVFRQTEGYEGLNLSDTEKKEMDGLASSSNRPGAYPSVHLSDLNSQAVRLAARARRMERKLEEAEAHERARPPRRRRSKPDDSPGVVEVVVRQEPTVVQGEPEEPPSGRPPGLDLDSDDDYKITVLPIGNLTVRPDLFQARDTDTPGQSVQSDRVKAIVDNFQADRFDPISVVYDSEAAQYVVIGGHHRLDAVEQLGKATVPVRILDGDPNDPADRDRLIRESVVSNYTVAAPNARESARAVARLQDTGLTPGEIAQQIRIRPSQVQDLIWINQVGPVVLDRIASHEDLVPVAAELGRAMEQYGLSEEAAGGLFQRYQREYVQSGRAPLRTALRDTFIAAHRAKLGSAEQGGMLTGFEDDSSLSALQELTAEIEAARSENRALRRNTSACRLLSERLDIKIDQLEEQAEIQLEASDQRIERLRSGIIDRGGEVPPEEDALEPDGPTETALPEPEMPAQTGANLFGEVVPETSPTADAAADPDGPAETALPEPEMPAQTGENLFGEVVPEAVADQGLETPPEEPPAVAPVPHVDPKVLSWLKRQGLSPDTTKIKVYHGTSGDFENDSLKAMPGHFDNEPPFDQGIWVTTNESEAGGYQSGEGNSRIIVGELDITTARALQSDDAEEANSALAGGASALLAAEGDDNIFLADTSALTIMGEVGEEGGTTGGDGSLLTTARSYAERLGSEDRSVQVGVQADLALFSSVTLPQAVQSGAITEEERITLRNIALGRIPVALTDPVETVADPLDAAPTAPALMNQQATLPDDFATNQNLGMTFQSDDFGEPPEPLADPDRSEPLPGQITLDDALSSSDEDADEAEDKAEDEARVQVVAFDATHASVERSQQSEGADSTPVRLEVRPYETVRPDDVLPTSREEKPRPEKTRRQRAPSGRQAIINAAIAKAAGATPRRKKSRKRHPFLSRSERQ